MDRATLIALVAAGIRYGHIGTAEQIVQDAAELVDLSATAAGADAPPAAASASRDVLASIGLAHLADHPNAAASSSSAWPPVAAE